MPLLLWLLTASLKITKLNFVSLLCSFPDEDLSNPLAPAMQMSENQHNRYQGISQNNSASLLPSNLLSASLGTIGQPYSADICNYGPVYHPHNLLHNYNSVYSNDKSMRNANFGRTMYGNYSGFYGNNNNLRAASMHQNAYDFTPRWDHSRIFEFSRSDLITIISFAFSKMFMIVKMPLGIP